MTRLFIEFTRPKGSKPISWVIRTVQGVPYSHVRLRWVNSVGVNIVYEASGSQVKFIGPKARGQHPVVVVESLTIDIDRAAYRELVRICMEYAGLKYGMLQLVGIGLAKLLRLSKNPLSKGAHQQVCSELVGRVISKVIGKEPPMNWDLAGPKEIYEWLSHDLDKKIPSTN